jgi:hypothetical protein
MDWQQGCYRHRYSVELTIFSVAFGAEAKPFYDHFRTCETVIRYQLQNTERLFIKQRAFGSLPFTMSCIFPAPAPGTLTLLVYR